MTPTLVGRWQTRLALLFTLGMLVSLPFCAVVGSWAPLVVIAWVAIIGLAWDVLYSFLQAFRWERDWPPAFAVVVGIVEAVVVYALATNVGLPGVPGDLSLGQFVIQYSLVWLVVFFFAQGPMRALFPWWRFHGGRLLPRVSSSQRR